MSAVIGPYDCYQHCDWLQSGFLTDDLTVQPNMTGGMAKYLGVCKLNKPGAKYRRIDIIVTPYSQVQRPPSLLR